MVDKITTVPSVVGPFFARSASLDTMDLESNDGKVSIPTYIITLDIEDSGNNLYQVGLGIEARVLRDIVLALQSAMYTGFSGISPRKA
jgi:hypothetical protein